jgi:hypothetical protein
MVSQRSSLSYLCLAAWLIAEDLLITNRHVLQPQFRVSLAARRASAPTEGRLRRGLTLLADFAYFVLGATPCAKHCVRIIDVPFIAPAEDPLDVAVLRIEPYRAAEPLRLKPLYGGSGMETYIVDHPAPLPIEALDEAVTAAFGNPDGTKRLSPGEFMFAADPQPCIMPHDCSTIGGHSGGPLMDLHDHRVAGLHFMGDPRNGNRAIHIDCLRRSSVSRLLAP